MKPIHYLVLALVGIYARAGLAADITVTGGWMETINASFLTAGAGSDLASQIESASGITVVTIANAPGNWTLRARKSGSGGHPDVTIHVRRSSSGSGTGSISGGTSFVALGGSDAEIFTGTEARENISLQFKLSGISKSIPPATYLSSIIFTVQ